MKIRLISMLLILCIVFPSLVGFTSTDESLTDDDITSLKIDEAPPESDVMATATGDEVISLNYSTLALAHNNTRTITATTNPSGLTVTWTSSNPSVAPVTSSGSVTGSKSGTAVITASVTDSDGNTHLAQCTVYVYLLSGVYYIKNMNSGQYIRPFSGVYRIMRM